MKGIIFLNIKCDNEVDFKMSSFDYELEPYGYSFFFTINENDKYFDLDFKIKEIEDNYHYNELFEDQEMLEFYNNNKNKLLLLLRNAQYVNFVSNLDNAFKYIDKNPIVRTKKIVFRLGEEEKYDYNTINKLYNYFSGNMENIYIEVSGNREYISYDEYRKSVDKLNQFILDIEGFNFSPLEKIMYAYDFVRNKVYNDVDSDEDARKCRDFTSSFLGEKIVCEGYANIFMVILNELGIKNSKVYLNGLNNKSDHARNEVYIKDEKYGVDGVYYFDSTWDSKKSEDDKSYLLSYKHFALTKDEFDELDEGELELSGFSCSFWDIYDNIYEWEMNDDISKIDEETIKAINYMSRVVYGNYLIFPLIYQFPNFHEILNENKKEILDKTYKLIEYFSKSLNSNILIEVLYNVRKKQYYANPSEYPFSLNDFYKTIIYSMHDREDYKINFLFALMRENDSTNILKKEFVEYVQSSKLDKRIEEVKLTRTLKKIYENKIKSR